MWLIRIKLQYLLGGFLLPLLGYSFGWLVALVVRDEYQDQLELATAALTKNITIANAIIHITVYFPNTESHILLCSLTIIMIPIPIIVQQLIYKSFRRSVLISLFQNVMILIWIFYFFSQVNEKAFTSTNPTEWTRKMSRINAALKLKN